MTRYFRWGYILPRLTAAVALYFLLEWGAGYALRRAVIDGGQAATGAMVEIEEARVSLARTQATLTGVEFASAEEPMQNLFSADLVRLDLDSDALLRKRYVVQSGVVRGLRFNTPRTTSGALAEEESSATTGALGVDLDLFAPVEGTAKRWASGIEDRLSADVTQNYASVQLAEDLVERWPLRYEQAEAEARALSEEVKLLKQQFNDAKRNPLRNAQWLAEMPARVAGLQQRLSTLVASVESLPQEIAADRQRIDQARLHDETLIRQRLAANQLDADSLTNVLLGESVTAPVGELIAWVRWARHFVPTTKGAPQRQTPRDRGTDVLFAGVRPRPQYVLQTLYLDGVAQLAGRPVEFRGTLAGGTTEPKLLGEPMTLVLESRGGAPMVAKASFDRTGDLPVDQLVFKCQELALPRLDLEAGKRIQLAVDPSTASLTANLRVEGKKLSGVVQLVQENVRMNAHASAGASPIERSLASAVSQGLSRSPRAATSVTLSGTLERPGVALSSTLGQSLAQALSGQADSLLAAERERLTASLRGEIDARLAGVEAKLTSYRSAIDEAIAGPLQEVRQLATGAANAPAASFFERIGSQVPESGLFR